jgi:CP family cyanate transporter-like MFS transporter
MGLARISCELAILSGLAVLCWLPQLRGRRVAENSGRGGSIWRSALAWQVTLFMGLQSLLFYINVTWLPVILHERGMSIASAGWMLSAMQFVSLPMSFIVPVVAGRQTNQRMLVIVTVIFHLIGYVGLLYEDVRLTWLWMICIGIAAGSSISLALAFFGLRTQNARQAVELSGMAQSVGYLLAAVGPILFGYLHDVTSTWFMSLLILAAASVLLLVAGLGAGRNAFVSDSAPKPYHVAGRVSAKSSVK